MTERRYDALLLDAFGTLITVDAPVARLQEAIADQLDVDVSLDDAQAAFTAEMLYYADRCHLGRDADSLAALHEECVAIVIERLGLDIEPHEAVGILEPTIQYVAYPDTPPLLQGVADLGIPIAVVSNADYTLPGMLAHAGVHLEHVYSSAATGSSKPDPAIFQQALAGVGVAADRALHVGDTPAADAVGAAAAGVDVRIIDREGAYAAERADTIASLTEILELIA